MPLSGFENTIPTTNRLQTHALDRAATGIGAFVILVNHNVRDIHREASLVGT